VYYELLKISLKTRDTSGSLIIMAGILSYGVYIPRYRIQLEDIALAWDKQPLEIIGALHIKEKAVPAIDEDAVTIGVEACQTALKRAELEANTIQSVFVGSESHPYVVNPTSSTIAEILGVGNDYFAADLEFACKAATAGMGITAGLVDSGKIKYGLVIGADTAQAKPRDVLEFTAGSAAAAFILGSDKDDIIARILEMSSFTSDTPDFWRRDGARYPSHAGRFTGEPAYFNHVLSEGKKLFQKSGLHPEDFDYCVFHMPNGKFPRSAAKKLGFSDAQLKPSLTVDAIGNPYTASALVGLAAVLDCAKPHQKIFFVSYGSGAGSDGFVFETTNHIKQKPANKTVEQYIENKITIDYLDYLRKTKNI
jgi:hydroxymethylglutaryl-CoA synthase